MKQLIEACIRMNLANPHRRDIGHMSRWSANYALRTIRLDYGWGTGKTSTMMEMANRDDLIVVSNIKIRNQLRHATDARVVCADDIRSQATGVHHSDYRYVWVDDAPMLSESNDLLYSLTAELFIRLGA